MPVAATLSIATSMLIVTFDQPLVPGVSAVLNWTGRADVGAGAKFFVPAGPQGIAGSTVSGPVVLGGPTIGFDAISYLATIPDVIGLVGGLPAAAFSLFPLTVIP